MNINPQIRRQVVESLGRIINEERRKKGMTQESLCDQAKITRNFLSMIENGKRFPSMRTLQCLALCLGVKSIDLIEKARLDDIDDDFKALISLNKLAASKDPEKLAKLWEYAKLRS